MTKKQKKLLIRICVSLALFAVIFICDKFVAINEAVLPILYLAPYFVAGYDVVAGCLKNAVKGRLFDEQLLMTVATAGALIIGEYPESVFVMVFFQTGELFQNIAVGKSRKSVSALMELCPDEASVLRDGEEISVFAEEISAGETVIVRAGEKIAVDGVITDGESALDMRALTGESQPCDVYEGCSVKAGSINLTGILKIKAEKEFSESTAAKILELVENSTLNKAKTEKFLTRFSRYYTPTVVILAVLLAVIPSLITGEWKDWTYRSLIFLVVSCPCALVISVPMSFFGGIGAASGNGILVKGANYLEALGKASIFVTDKTGTLTTGEFSVKGISPCNGFSEDEIISCAASAECYSLHPIAKGIAGYVGNIQPPDNVSEISGSGVRASVGGKEVLAGNRRFLEKNGIGVKYDDAQGTVVYVAIDGKYAGFITLCDTVKENAGKTVDELKRLGVKRVVMLTGDNAYQAKEVADKTGITQFESELLPQDKAEYVSTLCGSRSKNESIVFVGDGINDAPVLALSDVGIAMGGIGSDAAIEAADVVIMDDNIEKCALGIKIAKKTRRIVNENVIFALGVKFAVLIAASFGLTNMWVGVFADVGVAVIAILNAMRTMKIKE